MFTSLIASSKSREIISQTFKSLKDPFKANSFLSPLSQYSITTASYQSFSRVFICETFNSGTLIRVIGIILSHFMILVISSFFQIIQAII